MNGQGHRCIVGRFHHECVEQIINRETLTVTEVNLRSTHASGLCSYCDRIRKPQVMPLNILQYDQEIHEFYNAGRIDVCVCMVIKKNIPRLGIDGNRSNIWIFCDALDTRPR